MNKISSKNKILSGIEVSILATVIILSTASITAAMSASSQSTNIERTVSGTESLSDVLLQEGFEDGTMPPSGWTHINNQDPPYTWHIVDTSDTDVGVHSGTYAAKVNRYHVSSQDEKLITPEIDLTGYADITLDFWAASWTWNPGATVKVIVQGDGIDDVIWDMIQDEVWETVEYRNVTLDLSTYTDETITICFQYLGIQGWHFGLDDIIVYAGEAPEPPELEIGEITGGWAGFGNGGKVSAEIKNIGLGNATDVEWSISATGNGILQKINESDDGTISIIGPDDVETIELVVGHHFGRINVTVTAYEPHFDIFVSKSVNGFIIVSLVIISR
jgi:hypothetical protein